MPDPTATIGAELIEKARSFLEAQECLNDMIRERDTLDVNIDEQGERVNEFRGVLLEYVGPHDPERFVIVDDKIVVIREGRNSDEMRKCGTIEIVKPVKP